MNSLHRTLTVTAATLGSAAALNTVQVSVSVSQLAAEIDRQEDHIAAIDLGERLMRGESIRIFDLRSLNEFEISHIPKATQCDLASLASMSLPHSDTIVVYSAGGAHAAQAWMVLRIRGYRKVHFLREGLYEWISLVLDPRLAVDATPKEMAEFERAKLLSHFFGGEAKVNVPRADLPKGYWTGTPNDGSDEQERSAPTIRRRGC